MLSKFLVKIKCIAITNLFSCFFFVCVSKSTYKTCSNVMNWTYLWMCSSGKRYFRVNLKGDDRKRKCFSICSIMFTSRLVFLVFLFGVVEWFFYLIIIIARNEGNIWQVLFLTDENTRFAADSSSLESWRI